MSIHQTLPAKMQTSALCQTSMAQLAVQRCLIEQEEAEEAVEAAHHGPACRCILRGKPVVSKGLGRIALRTAHMQHQQIN